MEIQPASLPQAFSGTKLFVNHSRLIHTAKSYLKKIKYFNALFGMSLGRHNYEPFTLIIIMRSHTSLTDCYV